MRAWLCRADLHRHFGRPGRPDALHRCGRPGAARPPDARLLSAEGRQIRFHPHRLSQLHRRARQARRPVRSRRPRRPDHRARNAALPKDQWTPERRRDPVATHNPMTRAQLTKLAPQFNWTATLRDDGPRRGEEGRRRRAERGRRRRQADRRRAAQHLEGISDLPLHQRSRERSARRRSTTRASVSTARP